jgi:hypothetical protein
MAEPPNVELAAGDANTLGTVIVAAMKSVAANAILRVDKALIAACLEGNIVKVTIHLSLLTLHYIDATFWEIFVARLSAMSGGWLPERALRGYQ